MSVEQQETSSAGVSSSPFSTDFNSLGSRGRMLILFGALQPMSRRPRTLFCGTGTAKRLPVPSEPSRKTWCNEWKVFFCQFWGAQTVVFFIEGGFVSLRDSFRVWLLTIESISACTDGPGGPGRFGRPCRVQRQPIGARENTSGSSAIAKVVLVWRFPVQKPKTKHKETRHTVAARQ